MAKSCRVRRSRNARQNLEAMVTTRSRKNLRNKSSISSVANGFILFAVALFVVLFGIAVVYFPRDEIEMYRQTEETGPGATWVVLIAGSHTFQNYRHESDVCGAYHILQCGSVKKENIIVFLYDDVAFDPTNPLRGVLLTKMVNGTSLNASHFRDHPYNVYQNVPKDNTGDEINAANVYNASPKKLVKQNHSRRRLLNAL